MPARSVCVPPQQTGSGNSMTCIFMVAAAAAAAAA
jgi:hypothetical protein